MHFNKSNFNRAVAGRVGGDGSACLQLYASSDGSEYTIYHNSMVYTDEEIRGAAVIEHSGSAPPHNHPKISARVRTIPLAYIILARQLLVNI